MQFILKYIHDVYKMKYQLDLYVVLKFDFGIVRQHNLQTPVDNHDRRHA